MSYIARLHAYQDMGFYEDPILSEAWYEITDPGISPDPASIESCFRNIAADFAKTHGNEIDPLTLGDFNWGDFIAEIPDEFLQQNGVRVLYGDVPQSAITVFVTHDELILA